MQGFSWQDSSDSWARKEGETMVLRIRSVALGALVALCFVPAFVPTAGAYFTQIYYPDIGEPWLDVSRGPYTAVLEELYGVGNFMRVDDSLDQIWWEYDGTATAEAKFAGHKHEIGYTQGSSGGAANLFATSGSGYNVSGGFTFDFDPNDFLRFNLKDVNTGDLWSSLESENDLDASSDHMVSFLITGWGGRALQGDNPTGHYVIAWEDLRLTGGSDKDYNDMVVEVAQSEPSTEIPEPGSLVLVGLLLLGSGARFIVRRRRH